MNSQETIVLGCGVIGLTTAIELQNLGMSVRIISRDLPAKSTSAVAPAMWHPYKVTPDERMRRWAYDSFQRFKELSGNSASGVIPTTILEYYATPVLEPWYVDAIDSFRRLERSELPEEYVDGFATESFVIDSSVYLNYLLKMFTDNGGAIEQRSVESFEEFILNSAMVVNCSGLGARKLANDETMFSIRGQVVRVHSSFAHSKNCIIDENGKRAVFYAVPRTNDVILGGTAELDNESIEPNEETTRIILQKAKELVPELSDSTVIESLVGLRPARPTVRLERDEQYPWLIHNYGHSGAGYTLSWGCAIHVGEVLVSKIASRSENEYQSQQ